MDETVVAEKLESLRRCIRRIEAKRPATVAELETDADLQDILSLNLTRAVQIAVDIATHLLSDSDLPAPETMGQAFRQLATDGAMPSDLAESMVAAVGFRNVAVHSYRSIDWNIVHAICHERLEDFGAFARHVADRLAAR